MLSSSFYWFQAYACFVLTKFVIRLWTALVFQLHGLLPKRPGIIVSLRYTPTKITSLDKNPRWHTLQSPMPNLKLPVVLPAHVGNLRQLFSLHHSANPLYPIILLSLPFSAPRSLLILCSPTEPYPSLHHVFGMTYHLNSALFLYLHHHHCQSQDIIFIRLLYPSLPNPQAFLSKLKCHLFKSSYPDSSDHPPSQYKRHPP